MTQAGTDSEIDTSVDAAVNPRVAPPTAGWVWTGTSILPPCCKNDTYTVTGQAGVGPCAPPPPPAGTWGYYVFEADVDFVVGEGRTVVSETWVKSGGSASPVKVPDHTDSGDHHLWHFYGRHTCDWMEFTLTIVTECERTGQRDTTTIKIRVVN